VLNIETSEFQNLTPWLHVSILTLIYHRKIYIIFLMNLIFESHCVELVYLLANDYLTVVPAWNSLQSLSLNQSLLLRLDISLNY